MFKTTNTSNLTNITFPGISQNIVQRKGKYNLKLTADSRIQSRTATKNQKLSSAHCIKPDTKHEIDEPPCSHEQSYYKAYMTDHMFTCRQENFLVLYQ